MSSSKRRDRTNSAGQPVPGPAVDSTTQNGYQRYPDASQPAHVQEESPIIPDYDPLSSNPQRPVRHSSSHRRRDSQGYSPSAANAGPPGQARHASHIPVSTQSTASKPVAGQDLDRSSSHTSRRYASDPLSGPVSASKQRPAVQTSGLERQKSIPHKSPLQALEVSFSKEEKRARVAEAEALAQQRVTVTRAEAGVAVPAFDNSRRDSQGQRSMRSVSGPARMPPPPMGANRGNVHSARVPDYHNQAAPRERLSGKALPDDEHYHDALRAPNEPFYAPGPGSGARAAPVPVETRPVAKDTHAHRKAAAAGALALGAATASYAARGSGGPAAHSPDVRSSTSRKLQKNPSTRERRTSGEADLAPETAYTSPKQPHNQVSPATAHTYRLNPQSGTIAPEPQKGLGIQGSQDATRSRPLPAPADHGFQLPNALHGGTHEDERRHQAPPTINEWKSVLTAKLYAEELDLTPAPTPGISADAAWWEKSEERRRSSGGASAARTSVPTYDGAQDQKAGQTYFSPPLYLKCGPLLRFRGIYRETIRSARSANAKARDIWRGSVMVVTVDSKSSYQTPPTLRVFKQPIDMLPPPPAEVNESTGNALSPEYVDPVAGQIKMSRVGKTLYVRPAEALAEGRDLSRREDDNGLFEEKRSAPVLGGKSRMTPPPDGEKVGKVREVRGTRLFAERGVTFWKFNLEVELGSHQARIAYRINRGPAIGFWVPGRGDSMNMMFHSCNGFSASVDPHIFSGPDPLWRDVLNTHQTRPFHVMIGGGDQIYNDAVTRQTTLFREWSEIKNPHHKHSAPFTAEMQDELENFYLNRYAMWFSQGLFGMANSQIPMVNIWDDHDIIDGFGSYPHHTMSCPVFAGIGAVAFKYYMLFQHQSVPEETEAEEPSWLLGAEQGLYINQLSRSLYLSMGKNVSLLGLDCRTERARDEILSDASWERIFQRCERDIVKGDTKHLVVLLGVPIAYPRLNFLENILTSRAMDPIKALGRTGMLGGFVNKFDGGVEILDDLDDHWTAKHHKDERNWFVQGLQNLAASKSVRITILGGDVHLGAVGQFFSNKKLGIPKDRDHRYMPNVISSAIVNTPPGDMLADVLNRRNKIHHLDEYTDESMIPIFQNDVDGKPRNNKHLLPRRNWCSIREYHPGTTPPPTPPTPVETPQTDHTEDTEEHSGSGIRRSLSLTRRNFTPRSIAKRFSRQDAPPMAFYNKLEKPQHRRASSADAITRPTDRENSYFPEETPARRSLSAADPAARPNPFVRRPTDFSVKQLKLHADRQGEIDLASGLDIRINMENVRGDPSGTTTEYRLIVPALDFRGELPELPEPRRKVARLKGLFGTFTRHKNRSVGGSSASISGSERSLHDAHGHPDRRPSPLGGWADHTAPGIKAPVSRKPVQDSLQRSTTGDSFPAPTSASPTKQAVRTTAPADDGRPARRRWRGNEDDDLLQDSDNTPHASSTSMTDANTPGGGQDGRNGNHNVDRFAAEQSPEGRTSMNIKDNTEARLGNVDGRGRYLRTNGLWVDAASPPESRRKSWRDWKSWRI